MTSLELGIPVRRLRSDVAVLGYANLGCRRTSMFAGEIIAGALLGSFACLAPAHDDANTIRCSNTPQIVRLLGIDAPAMPDHCAPGQSCLPGEGFAARETLRSLTLGRNLSCYAEGTDGEGRVLARCRVEDHDLSCAMIAAGQAVPRPGIEACNCSAVQANTVPRDGYRQTVALRSTPISMDIADTAPPPLPAVDLAELPTSDTPWSLPVAGAMVMIGLWMAMANLALLQLAHERWPSRQRWGAPMERLDPWLFLGLAAAGASPAAWTALFTRHAGRQRDPLKSSLISITGLQVGLVIGALWWCFSA